MVQRKMKILYATESVFQKDHTVPSFLFLHDLPLLYQISAHPARTRFSSQFPLLDKSTLLLLMNGKSLYFSVATDVINCFSHFAKKPIWMTSFVIDTFQSLIFLWFCKSGTELHLVEIKSLNSTLLVQVNEGKVTVQIF